MGKMHRFRDWANLPSEIVEIFMNKMDFPGMFKFGRICSSWRSLSSPIFKSTVESLLILDEDSYDNGSIWIYNPSDGIPYQVRLPVGFTKGKICGFTNESLALEEEENGNGISLLRLFSSTATDAIHLLPLPVHSESKKICLSSDESIAMAITRNTDEKVCTFNIFICNTKQDLSWELIEIPQVSPDVNPVVEDIIFIKGKFYAITTDGLIVIVHASTGKCYETSAFCAQAVFEYTYLAESLENSLLFITVVQPERIVSHIVWKNIEIDENFEYANNQFDRICDLGDHALFVSCNHARVIPTSDSLDLKKNMVYNTPDSRREWKGELVFPDGKPYRLGGRSLVPCLC